MLTDANGSSTVTRYDYCHSDKSFSPLAWMDRLSNGARGQRGHSPSL